MIVQHLDLLSARTMRQNAALPLTVAGMPKADADPSRLSGGQERRVGLARGRIRPA